MRHLLAALVAGLLGTAATADMYPISKKLVTYTQPVIALTNANDIDGTGAPVLRDQTLVMKDGRIAALGPAASTAVPPGAQVIDATGKTLVPGLVMVHEHMFFAVMTDFVAAKKPDTCPDYDEQQKSVEALDPASAPVQALFRTLIAHHVAITSTLPVFEATAQGRPGASKDALALLIPELQASYATKRMDYLTGGRVRSEAAYFANVMRLEKAFADAGGTLLAGTDPTGLGGVLPGYAGKREIELLVEEGFTVAQAIRIATMNGATYLGRDRDVGSLAVGKRADVVVIDGDLAADAKAIEAMPLVFKAGVGVLTKPVFERFKGVVGLY